MHEKSKEYICEKCSYTASIKMALTRHQDYVHGTRDKKFMCDICAHKTHTKQYLRLHLKNVHSITSNNPDRRVDCRICSRKFKHINALNGHMKLHGGYDKNGAEGKIIVLQDATKAPDVVAQK